MTASLEDFKILLATTVKPVFVLFSSSWCSPCKKIKPYFTKEAEVNDKNVFVLVDIDEASDITYAFNVRKIPTIKVFIANELKDEAYTLEQLQDLFVKYS